MLNYFNYFTEIEERFQQRRGSLLMLSTLDWALIETWQQSGIPIGVVLRGIDDAFDRYDGRKQAGGRRPRKVNGLAWCAQAVMVALEHAREAATGVHGEGSREEARAESGFEPALVGAYLEENARKLDVAVVPGMAAGTVGECAGRLRELAGELTPATSLEALDRTLTVLEERLSAALRMSMAEDVLVGLRASAERDLAPYRGKMQAVQINQIQQQILQKRMFEANRLPRLSLFYMGHR